MPVVWETLYDPGGQALEGVLIDVLLIASSPAGSPGYVGGTTILGHWQAATNSSGLWSVTLTANDLIEPDNTYYELVRRAPDMRTTDTFVVPNGAGPYLVEAVLVTPPGALTSVHEGKADPHPQYATDADVAAHAGSPHVTVASYQHDQPVPAATWTIAHGLGFRPNVTVIDTLGREVEGDVSYPSVNTTVLAFSAAFSGVAYLS